MRSCVHGSFPSRMTPTEEVTVASTACPFCTDERCVLARPVCLRLKRDVVDRAVRDAKSSLDLAVERLKGVADENAADNVYMDALVSAVSVSTGLFWRARRAQAALADK